MVAASISTIWAGDCLLDLPDAAAILDELDAVGTRIAAAAR
jgi:hypothetical protein